MASRIAFSKFPPVAEGHIDAWFALTSAKRRDIEQMLPDGFGLARQSAAPRGEHPLVILAGKQTMVRSRFFFSSTCLTYLEVGVMIPWVKCLNAKHAGQTFFRAVLYLDRDLPVVLGRLLGISKQKGKINRDYCSMRLRSESDKVLFSARFRSQKRPFDRIAAMPGFATLRDVFQQIHVGHMMDSCYFPTICTYCNLHLTSAVARPVAATFRVDERFGCAKSGSFEVPPIDDNSCGAFQLRTQWTAQPLRQLKLRKAS